MPFRADVDLSAILPRLTIDPGRQSLQSLEEESDVPIRYGAGAKTVSSCIDLVPYPSICWDVNGYYRELGVFWRASKKELREAYQKANGPDDARLTYIFRQLLNDNVRYEYDRMEFGSIYIDDYVQEQILRNAKLEARRRTNLDQWTHEEDVLKEWGFVFVDEVDEENQPEDLTKDAGTDMVNTKPVFPEDLWPYSFYKLGTNTHSVDLLKEWQHLLLEELKGHSIKFSVGWSKRGSGFKLLKHEDLMIFFLQEESTPSKRIAQAAVQTYMYRYV